NTVSNGADGGLWVSAILHGAMKAPNDLSSRRSLFLSGTSEEGPPDLLQPGRQSLVSQPPGPPLRANPKLRALSRGFPPSAALFLRTSRRGGYHVREQLPPT